MSSELLTPYDPAKYLTDDEDIEVFLADAEGTGDAGYIARAREVAERAKAMNQTRNEACSDSDYADLDSPEAGLLKGYKAASYWARSTCFQCSGRRPLAIVSSRIETELRAAGLPPDSTLGLSSQRSYVASSARVCSN